MYKYIFYVLFNKFECLQYDRTVASVVKMNNYRLKVSNNCRMKEKCNRLPISETDIHMITVRIFL